MIIQKGEIKLIIKPNSEFIRYTGWWEINEITASSTANGNYFEFSYFGECAVIGFDISNAKQPVPHVYISVDNGAKIEVPLDKHIRISAKIGKHDVKVILKSAVELQHRWYTPVETKVSVNEIEADSFNVLAADEREIIEFIGDSITEGLSIDDHYDNMIYSGDATAGYAWKTAEMLNMRPVMFGYGGLGITTCGNGGVPAAALSYGFYCNGHPAEALNSKIIVINFGTNDIKCKDKNIYKQKYKEFLSVVRHRNPNSVIIALSPFSGLITKETEDAVENYNQSANDKVFFVNTDGWIDAKPIHPNRYSHTIVSRKLTDTIRKRIK